jgi:hypothetical protein
MELDFNLGSRRGTEDPRNPIERSRDITCTQDLIIL